MEVISVINSTLRTALYVKLMPTWVTVANIQYTKETQAKRLQSHDHPRKIGKNLVRRR